MARPQKVSDLEILAQMRRSVLEVGPQVPLDAVAASLGVTGPALLRRFGNRQALMLRALLPSQPPAWFEVARQGPEAGPLEPQLKALLAHIFDFVVDMVPCMSALRESGISTEVFLAAARTGPLLAVKELTAWLAGAKKLGLVEAANLEHVATALLGALQMRAFSAHVARAPMSTSARRAYLADVSTLFARALTPLPRRTLKQKPRSRS